MAAYHRQNSPKTQDIPHTGPTIVKQQTSPTIKHLANTDLHGDKDDTFANIRWHFNALLV